jgi:hypothetical protein
MEDMQDEDILGSDLEANSVVADQNLACLAWLELGKPCAEPRVSGNSFRGGDKVLRDAPRGSSINGVQKLVHPDKVGVSPVCPLEGHDQRRARRLGLAGPSAHASTSL